MKLTKMLLIIILLLTIALFAIVWMAPDDSGDLPIEEALRFAGDISYEEKRAWLEEYKLGLELMEKEDYTAAIEVFDNAIAIDPDNGEAYYQIGKAYDQLKMEDCVWYYKAATFLYEGNSISEFEYAPSSETTQETSGVTLPVATPPTEEASAAVDLIEIVQNRESSGWEESSLRLSGAIRYEDGSKYADYTFHYNENDVITGYTVNNYWDDSDEITYTDIWEFTYDNAGNILKEYNPTSDSKFTYEYSYVDEKTALCKMIVESVEYRRFTIGTDERGHVLSVDGEGVYDSVYGFDIDYTYGSDMVPVRAKGSLTMSHGTTGKYYDYSYYPGLIQVDVTFKNEGKQDNKSTFFRIDDFQLLNLPDFYMDDSGWVELNTEGCVSQILNEDGSVYWELFYEQKSNSKLAASTVSNRRIARINEYNSKGVTEVNTFAYNREGRLENYTTTYYDKGNPVEKDHWTFGYYDDGQLFEERRDRGEEDYLAYVHIRDEGIEGYQTLYGRGIQQQFYYDFNADGTISGIRGEGIHDYYYKSETSISYDKRNNAAYSTGTLTGTESAEYQISKTYDFSYTGVVIVEEKTILNGSEVPAARYLRIDMPEYISLPEVVFYGSDEIITDDDGYIVKILDKNGTLRCELIFDYC